MERLAKDIFLNILTSTAFHNSQKVKMFFYLKYIIMKHQDLNSVSIMWYNENPHTRSGLNKTNFNVRKGVEFNVGDSVAFGKNKIGQEQFWIVEEITNKRQSSLLAFDYIETKCSFRVLS